MPSPDPPTDCPGWTGISAISDDSPIRPEPGRCTPITTCTPDEMSRGKHMTEMLFDENHLVGLGDGLGRESAE